jgi:exodeoxyribonuclease VII large subunit
MKTIGQREILSVAEVNSLAKEVLEAISFWVEGEIYDFKSADSRYYYVYFQLKDASGTMILPSIMLPQTFKSLDFTFENGQKVVAHGKLSLFTKSGKYQFMADTMELAGQGALAQQLEQLKSKLQAEGLFDDARKRPLPSYSQRVGVITSAASDAWADFKRHSIDKFPLIQLTIADVFVQGPKAVPSILRAIQQMQLSDLEAIVLTRGGGSLEDLSAFNDEQVARAIAASRIPVLVAVGHEKDISIADLVADVRASTPTNAGQLLTYSYEQAAHKLSHQHQVLQRRANELITVPGQGLDQAMRHLSYFRHKYQSLPFRLAELHTMLQSNRLKLMEAHAVQLRTLRATLLARGQAMSHQSAQQVSFLHRQLLSVSPLSILERGYSLVEVNGAIVRNSRQVKQGDTMEIRLHRGKLRGLITRVEDKNG